MVGLSMRQVMLECAEHRLWRQDEPFQRNATRGLFSNTQIYFLIDHVGVILKNDVLIMMLRCIFINVCVTVLILLSKIQGTGYVSWPPSRDKARWGNELD